MEETSTQPLVGIDPDDTLEVEVGGARFTVGIIEAGLWARLSNETSLAYQAGKRRAIRRLAEEGVDPEEVVRVFPAEGDRPERALSQLDVVTAMEPTYKERAIRVKLEVARYAVKGHSGFLKPRAQGEVPFTTQTATLEGRKVEVVGPETLRWYAANPEILDEVYLGATRLQELGVTEKKD